MNTLQCPICKGDIPLTTQTDVRRSGTYTYTVIDGNKVQLWRGQWVHIECHPERNDMLAAIESSKDCIEQIPFKARSEKQALALIDAALAHKPT